MPKNSRESRNADKWVQFITSEIQADERRCEFLRQNIQPDLCYQKIKIAHDAAIFTDGLNWMMKAARHMSRIIMRNFAGDLRNEANKICDDPALGGWDDTAPHVKAKNITVVRVNPAPSVLGAQQKLQKFDILPLVS